MFIVKLWDAGILETFSWCPCLSVSVATGFKCVKADSMSHSQNAHSLETYTDLGLFNICPLLGAKKNNESVFLFKQIFI